MMPTDVQRLEIMFFYFACVPFSVGKRQNASFVVLIALSDEHSGNLVASIGANTCSAQPSASRLLTGLQTQP